jgi:hypothetical protein
VVARNTGAADQAVQMARRALRSSASCACRVVGQKQYCNRAPAFWMRVAAPVQIAFDRLS